MGALQYRSQGWGGLASERKLRHCECVTDNPKIIDAEFEVVSEPDRRPFWERYQFVFDWRAAAVGGALSAIPVIRLLLGG